jgi:glyoxylase I family protein
LDHVSASTSSTLALLPERLHHFGWVVKDQEANRVFMEDVLGIPLAATWSEIVPNPEMGRKIEFCHTFYELADGSALAFFQFADNELYEMCQAETPAKVTRFNHIGFKVTTATYEELATRVKDNGYKYNEREHGYCKSLYVVSPDGLELEFAIDPPEAEDIITKKRLTAHADLAKWLAGDHASNNTYVG